jgi:hypothetical protein
MGYSTKAIRRTLQYVNVFQHHADDDIEKVRRKIIEMTCSCIESRQPISEFPLPLYCKSYNLRGLKDVRATLDELAWKRSELTGKFCGCPFWSVKAKSLFDQRIADHVKGGSPTLDDAWQLADLLSKQTAKIDEKLTHEHVFPRAHLLKLLQEPDLLTTFDLVESLIERMALGCVVLQSEHILLNWREGNIDNPWLRYRGVIRLAENPKWSHFQRRMIVEAGLL